MSRTDPIEQMIQRSNHVDQAMRLERERQQKLLGLQSDAQRQKRQLTNAYLLIGFVWGVCSILFLYNLSILFQ